MVAPQLRQYTRRCVPLSKASPVPTVPARAHHAHWPPHLPHALCVPETTLWFNLEVSAARYPDKAALPSSGAQLSLRASCTRQAEALAGWLQAQGVAKGDRVLLFMQNCPQFVVAFYADPARRRGGGAGQPDEPRRRVRPLHHRPAGTRRADERRPGRASWPRPTAALPPGQRLQHVLVTRFADAMPAEIDRGRGAAAGGARLAARRPAAARRAPCAGPMRWPRGHRPGPPTARPRRPGAAALHVGHHRPAQGLHAQPPHADAQRHRRRRCGRSSSAESREPGRGADVPRHRHALRRAGAGVPGQHRGDDAALGP